MLRGIRAHNEMPGICFAGAILAERLILENGNGSVTRSAWLKGNPNMLEPHPIRPPYPRLPRNENKSTGWEATIITNRETSDGRRVGEHQAFQKEA